MAMIAQGDDLVHQAEQALKKWSFFGGSDKYEDAAEKFQRAGNAYKAGKAWGQAASAFKKAAENFQKAKGDTEVTTCLVEAARAYVKAGDSKTATEVLETEALPRMVDAGRLTQAAKLHEEVAKMFDDEGQFAEAIEHYEKAADLFSSDNSNSAAGKCKSRVAHLAAQLDPPDFEKAAEVFEAVGAESLSSNLLKFGAKGYFQQAVMCLLARGDIVTAEAALNKFKDMDYTFGGSRECKLMEDVCAAFKDGSTDAFTDAVYNYDQISKLDPWKTSVLLKIKSAIQKANGEGADLT